MDGEPNAVGNAYHELLFGLPAAAELAPLAEKQKDASGQQTALPEPAAATEQDLVEASSEMAVPNGRQEHRYGDGAARIIDFRLIEASGRAVTRLQSLETYTA